MKAIFFAAAAALSLGVGSANADERAGQAGGYLYPDYTAPDAVVGGAPASVQKSLPVETAQNGQTIPAYVARSQGLGTWLFPPSIHGDGGNN